MKGVVSVACEQDVGGVVLAAGVGRCKRLTVTEEGVARQVIVGHSGAGKPSAASSVGRLSCLGRAEQGLVHSRRRRKRWEQFSFRDTLSSS